MKNAMARRVFGIASVCLLLATGCGGPAEPGSGAGPRVRGEIVIEGSSTVEPISQAARQQFSGKYPAVNISVGGNGTGNGFQALAKRECDIADASRPIKAVERDKCLAAGVEFIEIPVAFDGLTVVVNPRNTFVQQLDVEQLISIFRADKAARTWKDVNPQWPAEVITIYAPGVASGTHDYFMEVIGAESGAGMRSDEQTNLSEDDKQLVTGVQGEEFSIGFFGYAYYEAASDKVRAVPIVSSEGVAVMPTRETIESGEYEPFSRPLFIYASSVSIQRAEVRTFVDFYLENIEEIVSQARYVPLPAGIYEKARARVTQGTTGTLWLDESGNKPTGSVSAVYGEGPEASD